MCRASGEQDRGLWTTSPTQSPRETPAEPPSHLTQPLPFLHCPTDTTAGRDTHGTAHAEQEP